MGTLKGSLVCAVDVSPVSRLFVVTAPFLADMVILGSNPKKLFCVSFGGLLWIRGGRRLVFLVEF